MKAWLIDEDRDQRETYGEILNMMLGNIMGVCAIEPKPTLAEMGFIIDDPETSLIVIDEKLKDTGIAKYLGIELAQHFRAANKKVPIYILTNHPQDKDEFKAGEWSVEDVLDKGKLQDCLDVLRARLLRRTSSYADVLGEREQRYESLLRKSLDEQLSAGEQSELQELYYLRTTPLAIDELGIAERIRAEIQEKEKLLEEIGRRGGEYGR